MSASLLLFAWLLPLLLALLPPRRLGPLALLTAPAAAFAALLWLAPGQRLELSWLLLGTELSLDETGYWFLLASALLWQTAAVQRLLLPDSPRVASLGQRLFLLAMAGNFLLVLAADARTFYFGFALMGLSAYGLIIGRRSQQARHAGRLYLIWTLAGELALFLALVLSAIQAESLRFADLAVTPLPTTALLLLLFGFGIKLALPGLHFWMPAAYAAAPATAAAVLSGPMFSAGLLGLLRFLPPGQPGLAAWSAPVLAAGVLALAYALLAGLLTTRPRRVLGYSSMLKSGILLIVLALAWRQPEAAPVLLAALLGFGIHHLLIKGGLFLGLGLWERGDRGPLVFGGLLLLALGLVGAPLTAGAVLKQELAAAVPQAGWGWLLSAAALGSVLLMLRLFQLLGRPRTDVRLPAIPLTAWWLLVAGSWWFPAGLGDWQAHVSALPVLSAGLLLGGLGWLLVRRLQVPRLPRWRLRGRVRRALDRLRERIPAGQNPLQGTKGRLPSVSASTPTLALAGQAWLFLLLLLLFTLAGFR